MKINKTIAEKLTKGRIKKIQEGPCPEYPLQADHKEFIIEISIKQRSPYGVKEDNITAFMAHNRSDSLNIKDGDLMLVSDDGKSLERMGPHRLMAWIAREKIIKYGSFI